MEQMTVNITKYKEHSEDGYKAWQEVWNEYSKEFVDATDVKFLWAYQEQDDGVYYVSINMFPSKDARNKWMESYDADAGTKEFQDRFAERIGMTSEEADEKYGKEMELIIGGMEISNSNQKKEYKK